MQRNASSTPSLHPLLQNLFVGSLYFITGYFCLFLATSPSWATPVWAPAGIALGAYLVYGARILPAIYVGAFLIGLYTQNPPFIAVWTSIGAVFQAFGTGKLIQWAKIDLSTYRLKYILLFALLSGPIGCLINTSITNAMIFFLGEMPSNLLFQNVLTWWVGDSIGVLTITPMFLILFAKPREIWRLRITPILLPMSVCFFIAVVLGSFVLGFVQDHKRWEAYFVLLSGQLFCILMNVILSIIYGQKSLIEHEVQEKTAALQRVMEDLEKMAHLDSLTNIPNRRSFFNRLQEAIARSRRTASLMATCLIDLDNFKEINDTLGHDYGDALLKMLPKIFSPLMRETDYIARLGGDEFGLILENIHSAAEVNTILNRIAEELNRKPLVIFNTEIYLTLSIGIALHPNAGTDAQELLKNADVAMYRAKKSGKNAHQFYNEEINQQIKRQQKIRNEMKNALSNQEFYLNYQPQFHTKTKSLAGAEAFLGWNNQALGEVAASEFIPNAEENKQIIEIGEWAIKQACADFKKAKANSGNKLKLSMQISMKLIEDDNFYNFISQLNERYNLKENRVIFEIMESNFSKNTDKTIQILHRIQSQGIEFALKNFGIDSCSLLLLKSLPLSEIKISPFFIREILHNKNDFEIVKATIGLSQTLGYTSVAEGVETEEQYQCLVQLGCDLVQGRYLTQEVHSKEPLAF